MAFVKRMITAQFALANGVFSNGGNSATVEGLRISCKISKWSGYSMGTLECAIYGMPLSLMNQLTTVGRQVNFTANNTIIITAGDEQSGLQKTYQGTIKLAVVDGTSQPDVAFRVSAHAGAFQSVKPVEPTSVRGSADVATIMSGLASKMGLQFENNGVTTKLSSPYFWGDAYSQMKACAKHAGCEAAIDNGTLAIWRPGTPRQGAPVMVSPQNGLIGYPACTQSGVTFRMLFNPALKQGGKITLQSDLTPACGDWYIGGIDLDLESQVPNGQWFATVTCTAVAGLGPLGDTP